MRWADTPYTFVKQQSEKNPLVWISLLPPAFGLQVLQTVKLGATLPVLGVVEVQTSLFLDVGVYVLIIGVVLDLLRSLGSGIERDLDDPGERPQ